jgi:16S rRNA (uracil1498-N3)-methyltransferase
VAWLFALAIGKDEARLAADEVRHLSRVLRRRAGERLRLVDGQGTRAVGVWQGDDRVAVESLEAWPQPTRRLVLALGARESVEEGVRRAAEIGVAEVQLVLTDRSRDAGARLERWRDSTDRLDAIMRAGCGQSGNPWLPALAPIRAWSDLRPDFDDGASVALAASAGRTLLEVDPLPQRVAVGPEGGWADDELQDCPTATLGHSVLRAPVAVAVALGALQIKESATCAA